ncbi:MAG: hypothetical protein HUK21_07280 [Fibrobacteraceae bacterium]|nr:hypothetical protein [Fibrobacteraceae bacterium]
MNGKSPFDEAEEKLEQGINPHDPKVKLKMQGPIMSWQDGLFLLVLIGLVVGGYYYYQYIKKNGADTFTRCDALYTSAAADDSFFAKAEACYDSTWELSFVSDSLELLRQERLGYIDSLRTLQKDIFALADASFKANDTAAAFAALKEYKGPNLLVFKSDIEAWNSWMALLPKD